jgi:hypothetical protein
VDYRVGCSTLYEHPSTILFLMDRDPHFLSQERFEWSGNSVVSLRNINSHYCWKFIKISNFEARLQNCEKRLHWSTKILSHEEKCLFLMYFWTVNSNMFPEFLYHPHLSRCIRLCESTNLHI